MCRNDTLDPVRTKRINGFKIDFYKAKNWPLPKSMGSQGTPKQGIESLIRRHDNFIKANFDRVPPPSKLPEVLGKVDERIREMNDLIKKLPNQTTEDKNFIASARKTLEDLERKRAYLSGYAQKNPFSRNQALASRKLDVEAAIKTLDGYLSDYQNKKVKDPKDKEIIQKLTTAKTSLQKRKTKIENAMKEEDKIDDDPNKFLGPTGYLRTPKGKLKSYLANKSRKKLKTEATKTRKEIVSDMKTAKQDPGSVLEKVDAASSDINENDLMRKFLVATLSKAKHGGGKVKVSERKALVTEVNARQGVNHVKARNDQSWIKVNRTFLFRSKKTGKPVECQSVVTPASKLSEYDPVTQKEPVKIKNFQDTKN